MGERCCRRVAITGATGYVGDLIRRRCEQAGWSVVSLCRPATMPRIAGEARPYSLEGPVDPLTVGDLDALIHSAWDLRLTTRRAIHEVNVAGTRRLMEAATEGKVGRIIFISSMSAYPGTSQAYGQAKLACERIVARMGGVSIRPGLVYGDTGRGMAGTLRRLASLPVVPVVGGGAAQFTVHEDDLASGVLKMVTSSSEHGALGLAHPEPVPFRRLLEGIGRTARSRRYFAPVPWRPLYCALRAAEMAHVPLPVRADSLLGVVRPAPHVPQWDEWARHGVSIRAFDL